MNYPKINVRMAVTLFMLLSLAGCHKPLDEGGGIFDFSCQTDYSLPPRPPPPFDPTPPAVNTDRPTIIAILYDGHYVPVSQLRPAKGPECPYEHYHARSSAVATDGTVIGNPNSAGCGFGATSQPTYEVDPPN